MDPDNCLLASNLVSKAYISQGSQALARRRRLIKSLLSQRKLPVEGWDEASIELFIQDAALMDSNNFIDNVGVGEREARVASPLVYRRHYGLAHGIGRSGDVAAEQPKAAGSSLLAKLTNLLVADALSAAGFEDLGAVTVLPLATGMALTVTLLALKATRPAGARYVIWPRIDQKTCLKAIISAGLEAVVVANKLEGDQLRTDEDQIKAEISRLGPENVVCVVTTTSCFAPRAADRVVEVAKLCAAENVGHIVNNAYGVQSAALCKLITSAWRKGRVDAVVQSTDKNFMMNESRLVWNDDLKQRLIQQIAAQELGIAEEVMASRLKELQLLLPDLIPKMSSMKPTLLARLAADAPGLAAKLVTLKAIFPAANAGVMVARRPALVLVDDLEAIRDASHRLRKLLPDVDIDRMVEEHPSMLDVDSFELALAEAKRLMPNLDITNALNTNPSIIFSCQRGSQLIPYDEVPTSAPGI
ncbi:hypothetical protein WJX72_010391 [[Myrmecia] bisecta]|uniref:O-phosphoseryl-tRNA(Sec) selenium transferase n=1 Tax=[Myrmecia] bisecta TaxID=41462 RepID=A0AAW1PQZ0_9CHLO